MTPPDAAATDNRIRVGLLPGQLVSWWIPPRGGRHRSVRRCRSFTEQVALARRMVCHLVAPSRGEPRPPRSLALAWRAAPRRSTRSLPGNPAWCEAESLAQLSQMREDAAQLRQNFAESQVGALGNAFVAMRCRRVDRISFFGSAGPCRRAFASWFPHGTSISTTAVGAFS